MGQNRFVYRISSGSLYLGDCDSGLALLGVAGFGLKFSIEPLYKGRKLKAGHYKVVQGGYHNLHSGKVVWQPDAQEDHLSALDEVVTRADPWLWSFGWSAGITELDVV